MSKHREALQLLLLGFICGWSLDVTTGYTKGSRRKEVAEGFLDCGKCWGHGVDPTADPRCKFGCNRIISFPPTKIPCEECVHSPDPGCKKSCDDGLPPSVDALTWERIFFTSTLMFQNNENSISEHAPLPGNLQQGESPNPAAPQHAQHYHSASSNLRSFLWLGIGIATCILSLSTLIFGYKCRRTKSTVLAFHQVDMDWQAKGCPEVQAGYAM